MLLVELNATTCNPDLKIDFLTMDQIREDVELLVKLDPKNAKFYEKLEESTSMLQSRDYND